MSKRKKWRCFFCDEVFEDRRAAWYHFGESNCDTDVPACIDPLRQDERDRLKELRDAQAYAVHCQEEAQKVEEDAELLGYVQNELQRYFGTTSPHQAWLKLEAAENEAKDGRRAKDLVKEFALCECSQTSYAELKGSQSMDIPVEFLALCEFAEEMGVKLP